LNKIALLIFFFSLTAIFYSCKVGTNKIYGNVVRTEFDSVLSINHDILIPNVTIDIINQARANTVATAITDADGWFDLHNIKNGTYTLHAYITLNGKFLADTLADIQMNNGTAKSVYLYLN
jgi:hypothetical protein